VAERVCSRAQQAAAKLLGATVTVHVRSADAANLVCGLQGAGSRVVVVAQASPQAWTEFDTTQSHQAQVYGPGIHEPGQIPRNMSVGNALAEWIPAQSQLFATNGSPTRGGSYVTVTVAHRPRSNARRARLAQAVGLATLATAPRGPNPGHS
jgi:hypothetical protein